MIRFYNSTEVFRHDIFWHYAAVVKRNEVYFGILATFYFWKLRAILYRIYLYFKNCYSLNLQTVNVNVCIYRQKINWTGLNFRNGGWIDPRQHSFVAFWLLFNCFFWILFLISRIYARFTEPCFQPGRVCIWNTHVLLRWYTRVSLLSMMKFRCYRKQKKAC